MGSITNSHPADGFRSLVLNLKPGKDIEHSHLWRGSSILATDHKHRNRAFFFRLIISDPNLTANVDYTHFSYGGFHVNDVRYINADDTHTSIGYCQKPKRRFFPTWLR